MATVAELEALTDQIAAGEPGELAKPPLQHDNDVRIAANSRIADPFVTLCVNAKTILERLVFERWPPPNGLDPRPEYSIIDEFVRACSNLLGREGPQQELPSSVLRRALFGLGAGVEPQNEAPFVAMHWFVELDDIALQTPALRPIDALARELNLVWAGSGIIASALVLRELVQAVSLALGYGSLKELIDKHPGGLAFKAAMGRLSEAMQDVMTVEQVVAIDTSALRARIGVRDELDQLLEELIRMTA